MRPRPMRRDLKPFGERNFTRGFRPAHEGASRLQTPGGRIGRICRSYALLHSGSTLVDFWTGLQCSGRVDAKPASSEHGENDPPRSHGFHAGVVITAGCESARGNGETDAVRSVVAVTDTESPAFAGMEAEYYVIAYMHCKRGLVALAEG
jgi:hypothetical protein